ncbi:MAG: polymorphic toxin-type HINT domain-containing protein, partial [Planctomycetaceae bacterium]
IEQSPTARPLRSEPVIGPSGAAYYARAIETIQTGQRVLARNPELAGVELPDALVDPATWVNIRLRMPKPTGDFLEITLLRPVEWLAEHLAQATALDGEYPQALVESRGTDSTSGSTTVSSVMPTVDPPELSPGMVEPITGDSSTASPWIFLTLHELEAVGPAEIVEVGPCPELEPGEGRLGTGTFSHQSGEVFDIAVDGLSEPIGCTGAHPFWSEDRHAFIPARDLVPGETVRTESGTLRQITRITPRRGPPVPVFNLEVDAEHVYFVSVDGVLVHNACGNLLADPPGLVPWGTQSLGRWGEDRLELLLEGLGFKPTKPFITSDGPRYIDRLLDGIAHESKAGVDVRLTSRIRRQILKDRELIDEEILSGAHWHFWQGADKELLDFLTHQGISFTVH